MVLSLATCVIASNVRGISLNKLESSRETQSGSVRIERSNLSANSSRKRSSRASYVEVAPKQARTVITVPKPQGRPRRPSRLRTLRLKRKLNVVRSVASGSLDPPLGLPTDRPLCRHQGCEGVSGVCECGRRSVLSPCGTTRNAHRGRDTACPPLLPHQLPIRRRPIRLPLLRHDPPESSSRLKSKTRVSRSTSSRRIWQAAQGRLLLPLSSRPPGPTPITSSLTSFSASSVRPKPRARTSPRAIHQEDAQSETAGARELAVVLHLYLQRLVFTS
jgi:hypothetical protein